MGSRLEEAAAIGRNRPVRRREQSRGMSLYDADRSKSKLSIGFAAQVLRRLISLVRDSSIVEGPHIFH